MQMEQASIESCRYSFAYVIILFYQSALNPLSARLANKELLMSCLALTAHILLLIHKLLRRP